MKAEKKKNNNNENNIIKNANTEKKKVPELPKEPTSYDELRNKVLELMNYIDDTFNEADDGIAKIIYDTSTLLKHLYENRDTKEVVELMGSISEIVSAIGIASKMENILPYYPYTINAVRDFVKEMSKYTCILCGLSPSLEPCKPEYIQELSRTIQISVMSPYQPNLFEQTREILTKDLIYLRNAIEVRKRVESLVIYTEKQINSISFEKMPGNEIEPAKDLLSKLGDYVNIYLAPTYMVYSIALGFVKPLTKISLKLGVSSKMLSLILEDVFSNE